MVLRFFTAFYDCNYELVLDRKKIALNYLKGTFFIDLLSTVSISNHDYTSFLRVLQIPRHCKIFKVLRYKWLIQF